MTTFQIAALAGIANAALGVFNASPINLLIGAAIAVALVVDRS